MRMAAAQSASMHDWVELAGKMEHLYQEVLSRKLGS